MASVSSLEWDLQTEEEEDFGPKPVTCPCETQIIQANATNVRSTETDISFP